MPPVGTSADFDRSRVSKNFFQSRRTLFSVSYLNGVVRLDPHAAVVALAVNSAQKSSSDFRPFVAVRMMTSASSQMRVPSA